VEFHCKFEYESTSYNTIIWESVTLFNCLLFHNKSSGKEEFIESTVNFLKERLLHDPDMELIPDGLDKNVTFNTVLYHWFFNGFLECSDYMLDHKAQDDENDVIQWRAYSQKESNDEEEDDESDIEDSMEEETSDTEESMDKKKASSKKRKTQVESDEEPMEEEEHYEKKPKKKPKKVQSNEEEDDE